MPPWLRVEDMSTWVNGDQMRSHFSLTASQNTAEQHQRVTSQTVMGIIIADCTCPSQRQRDFEGFVHVNLRSMSA